MTTPVRPGRRTLRARLLAFIADATGRLTTIWRLLTRAQTTLLRALAAIRPGRNATSRIRTAEQAFRRALAQYARDLTAFIERWAATDLPIAYRDGALTTLDHARRPHTLWSWTPTHQGAITTLSAQFYSDLTGRLRDTLRRAEAFLRAALAAARARATRFDPAPFRPAALRREHPLDTVLYAGNRRHPVEAWARAALTWQAVTTANTGSILTAAEQLACTHVEVRDGAGCGWTSHQDPDTADGTLRTISDALAHPTAHPHCIREMRPHLGTPGSP
ncbi:hypothetical protein [Streptomyces sp. DH12]|uniref:hypothetical protein n=1 Tax=Streptomyces sp. DH12 TaxID=2857010 RepID=UPI001E4B094A|nr:hypothetical protein [Streptomyces sp. DH12]